jgi:hypothetical protein
MQDKVKRWVRGTELFAQLVRTKSRPTQYTFHLSPATLVYLRTTSNRPGRAFPRRQNVRTKKQDGETMLVVMQVELHLSYQEPPHIPILRPQPSAYLVTDLSPPNETPYCAAGSTEGYGTGTYTSRCFVITRGRIVVGKQVLLYFVKRCSANPPLCPQGRSALRWSRCRPVGLVWSVGFLDSRHWTSLLRRGEFGNGLGSFRNGMLGEFTGQHETNSRLDFATAQRGFFVVGREFTGLTGDAFENIVNERVHDAHTLFGNARIGMDLFQDFVNVRRVTFRALLVLRGFGARGLGGLGGGGFAAGSAGFGRGLGHGGEVVVDGCKSEKDRKQKIVGESKTKKDGCVRKAAPEFRNGRWTDAFLPTSTEFYGA